MYIVHAYTNHAPTHPHSHPHALTTLTLTDDPGILVVIAVMSPKVTVGTLRESRLVSKAGDLIQHNRLGGVTIPSSQSN